MNELMNAPVILYHDTSYHPNIIWKCRVTRIVKKLRLHGNLKAHDHVLKSHIHCVTRQFHTLIPNPAHMHLSSALPQISIMTTTDINTRVYQTPEKSCKLILDIPHKISNVKTWYLYNAKTSSECTILLQVVSHQHSQY